MPQITQLKAVSPQATVTVNTDLNHSIEKEESYGQERVLKNSKNRDTTWQNADNRNSLDKLSADSQPKLSHNFLNIPLYPKTIPFIQPKLLG